ncbi:MAG TPA: prolyl oligopeptidase family serine peptidase [Polyangiaceae bacterium]|nr:prolyl oligopeptidase family serine peptidase [Polyangiaceae bacterium]
MQRRWIHPYPKLVAALLAAACAPSTPAAAPASSEAAAAAHDAASAPVVTAPPSGAQALLASEAAGNPAARDSEPPPADLIRITRVSAATHAERDHFLYLPKGWRKDSEQRWPVMLFLHGNGERGDAKADLDYLLKNGPLYEAWIQKRDLPFIVIAPQLPMYGMDEKADYLKKRTRAEIPERLPTGVPERPAEFATPSPMTGAVSEPLAKTATSYGPPKGWPELETDLLAMLDDVLANYHGDPDRQYLTGLSYGGFGTWYIASKHPDRFAAIVPVVGYGHPDLMPPIAAAKLPIWCFAGGRDDAVKVKYFYPGLNRLEQLGHQFRFSIEEDMGHDVWARVYAGNDVYDWMLAHQKASQSGRAVAP